MMPSTCAGPGSGNAPTCAGENPQFRDAWAQPCAFWAGADCFQALSYGDRKGILAAHAFVSPTIVQDMGVDAERFEAILGGIAFEGLIGCASWTITGTNTLSDDEAAVRLRVLPRPIPGCVKLSGMADQDGITWPAFYSWQMRRQAGGEFDGCWMLYQMQQAPPPIDVESDGGTPRVAAG